MTVALTEAQAWAKTQVEAILLREAGRSRSCDRCRGPDTTGRIRHARIHPPTDTDPVELGGAAGAYLRMVGQEYGPQTKVARDRWRVSYQCHWGHTQQQALRAFEIKLMTDLAAHYEAMQDHRVAVRWRQRTKLVDAEPAKPWTWVADMRGHLHLSRGVPEYNARKADTLVFESRTQCGQKLIHPRHVNPGHLPHSWGLPNKMPRSRYGEAAFCHECLHRFQYEDWNRDWKPPPQEVRDAHAFAAHVVDPGFEHRSSWNDEVYYGLKHRVSLRFDFPEFGGVLYATRCRRMMYVDDDAPALPEPSAKVKVGAWCQDCERLRD